MKNFTSIYAVLGAALCFSTLTACGDDGKANDESSTSNTTAGPTSDPMTDPGTTTDDPTTNGPTTNPPTTTTGDPTTDPMTETTDEPTTVGPTSTTTPDTDTDTGDDGFIFPDTPFDDYEQIDRHGAVEAGTAGIRASQGLGFNPGSDITIRDAYNASNPVEDAMMKWFGEIAESVTFFHDALDDDVMKAGLTPATIQETVAQAGPVILPDTIKYDPSKPTAYPNGRTLTDPVVDITLAAVLIKLGNGVPLSVLADLPLNPPKNDVDFLPEFPFLAPPHPGK